MKKLIISLIFLFGLLSQTTLAQAKESMPLSVVVSIKPLYGLVAGVAEGVFKPELLLPPPNSPHNFQLKPSDVQKIVKANLVVWIGPELENFLVTPLKNLKANTKTLTILKDVKLTTYPLREACHWHEGHNHDHSHHNHKAYGIDPHIWLDTQNAAKIVLSISDKLQQIDPLHAKKYRANTKKMLQKLNNLQTVMKNNLAAVNEKPFVVFHDAYQYFEKQFKLNSKGTISLNPQAPLSAKRLKEIQTTINEHHVQCVFREPEFNPAVVDKLLTGTGSKSIELDPLAARIDNSNPAEIYFKMMMSLSNNFQVCLLHS